MIYSNSKFNLINGGLKMTFTTLELQYRIAFDSESNRFLAIEVNNEENVAYGITIEQAIVALTEK